MKSSGRGSYRAWALIGLAFLTTEMVTLWRWISSPLFRPAPVGNDVMLPLNLAMLRTMEVFGAVGFAFSLWYFLISPWIRRRELSADGVIFIAMITAYWLDPVYNYTNFVWYYNAHAVNMGSWLSFIPGMTALGQETLPEPLFGAACLWFMAFAVFAKFGSVLYGRLRSRFGATSQLRPLVSLFLVAALFDFLFENVYIHMGVFGFAGVWRAMTLWPGKIYQFPLYEPIAVATVMGGLALLRYHIDDRGQMYCESGLHHARVSAPVRTVLRALAVVGFCQALVIFGWMLPYQWIAVHVDTFAELPSYLRAGICGESTPRACPDGSFGVPTRGMAQDFIVKPGDPRLRGR